MSTAINPPRSVTNAVVCINLEVQRQAFGGCLGSHARSIRLLRLGRHDLTDVLVLSPPVLAAENSNFRRPSNLCEFYAKADACGNVTPLDYTKWNARSQAFVSGHVTHPIALHASYRCEGSWSKDMADPFASATAATRLLHPSLSTSNTLPIDFFEPLVCGFLEDERYAKWAAGYMPWQLHCHGGPGCGKSTFALRVVEDLKKRHQNQGISVAYVHVKERVLNNQAEFVEDFLFCLYKQVCNRPANAYESALRTGQPSTERLKRIRGALHQQLKENEHSFLVFDGYDTLDIATCMLIDYEFKDPGLSNISLLVTRRSPPYKRPENLNIGCDSCERAHLSLYWQCQICGENGPQYCCECKENGACTNGEHKFALSEPYSRIDLDLTKTPRSAMIGFIAHELETHSRARTQDVKQRAADILARVGGNINLAKLRIDDLLTVDDLSDDQLLRDRLPRSVVAFFDAEIDNMLQDKPLDRNLGVLAVASVAQYGDPQGFGMKAADLERSLRQARNSSPHLVLHPTKSLEDVITAANGLLVLQPYEDDLYVACFNKMLKLYAREDYNEVLYKAKARLSLETDPSQHEGTRSWIIAPSTTSPPTISDVFDNKDYMDARSSSHDSAYYSRSSSMNTKLHSRKTVSHTDEPRGLFECTGSLPIQSNVVEAQGQSVPPVSLCEFCQEHIFNSNDSAGSHHMSCEAILNSLTSGCVICMDLYMHGVKAENRMLELVPSAFKDWHYRWALRSTGRSQNRNSSFGINFTPLASGGEKFTPLPHSKKYHIVSEADVNVAAEGSLAFSTNPSEPGGGLQIRQWMKICAETHEHCNKHQKSEFVPTRLVDLETEDSSMVRIVQTAKENITGPYLTLSHSWGPPTFLQLKRDNESELMGKGVMITELTPNFQQAISVAKFIGMRYIWIDSLCIIQGPGGDFKSEGQLMHKVYRHSHCNIAIADSSDSEGGLFRQRNPVDILPTSIEADGTGKLPRGTWRILEDDLWDKELLATKIYTRGWVFQERMLSPRILHFAASQIFWDCSTLSACEALPRGLPHSLDAKASTDRHWRGRMQRMPADTPQKYDEPIVGASDDSIEIFWRSALLRYTSCNLTNQGDKSVAIWSIAKLVRDILGERYGGGLWEANLEEQLAWHSHDVVFEGDARLPELQSRYPSWSWASMKGPIVAHSRLSTARQYVVENHVGDAITFESHFKDKDNEPILERIPMALSGIGRVFRRLS
ncbi:HET-domain-containing protein [Paraphaeosphaeria sporulosa]|uniref:HET-domain-containing protein n=1 Tax=Paraphaeosphaeria sporulosa TaxID=1460663 RepID=A0A177C539_9PLEO|nr:HET-domain-containing protein [Paraphaeosphaeria sporulosa]OAG01999.1 HET-domain-containing protein [Paraphaeosphaeria sporulosa]